ncbi:VapE domain-containing protein [Nitrobacter sp. JJSN]|uniref:VapE domain-containing protein n=1 Tax=Nitrobacter sp. JJSN TaxID=3453033 RepID=UPI003F75CAF6
MTDITTIQKAALDYAEQNKLALFAIDPVTHNGSLYNGHRDRARWEAAYAAGMHLGVSAINSDCLLFDVDVHGPDDRDEAWSHYLALCDKLQIGAVLPYAHSKSGGWHFAFRAPSWFKDGLRKGHHKFKLSHFRPLKADEIDEERISIRWLALNVYAGSVTNSGVYQLAENAPPPHAFGPGTAKLFDWYAGLKVGQGTVTTAPPTDECRQSDAECAKLERFVRELMLKDPSWFEDRDNRLGTVWGIKRAGFGIRGYEIAGIICDVTEDREGNRLNRYWNDSGANQGTKTLASFWKKCADLGIKQDAQEIAEWRKAEGDKMMVQLGVAAGGTVPMVGGRAEEQVKQLAPILEGISDVARTDAHPMMPATGHPLVDLINRKIPGIMATGNIDAIAAVAVVHQDTATALTPMTPQIEARAERLSEDVEHKLRSGTYTRGRNGNPEGDNPQNLRIFLAGLGIDVRWNAWTEKVELKGWRWPNWSVLTDRMRDILMTRASESDRLVMAENFVWRSLLAFADDNSIDPACDLLDRMQAAWDGRPRLHSWLSNAAGVPNDAYHRAVGRLILIGMVARIRIPGIKFDTMPVFVSETEGTGKSSLAKVLALRDEWFTESIKLGDEPKELVLLLAGKSVAEISEMRNRGDIEGVKAMLSRTHDAGRTAFSRAVTDRPRRNIFVGSTNKPQFLEADSGGRRFWPIAVVGEINASWMQEHLAQLIGEAATLQAQGEALTLPRDIWAIAGEHQEAARTKSDMELQLREWFGGEQKAYITSEDLVDLAKLGGWSKNNASRGTVMRSLGFKENREFVNGTRKRVWLRGEMNDFTWRYTVGTKLMNGLAIPKVALIPGTPTTNSATGLPPLPPPPH